MRTEKMVRTARTLEKVFRILQIPVFLAVIASVVILGGFTALAILNPERAIEIGTDTSIEIGTLTFELAKSAVPEIKDVLFYGWTKIGYGAVFFLLLGYMLGRFRMLLRPIAEARPFAPSAGKEIRKLAFACLAAGIAQNLFLVLETLHTLHVFKLSDLLEGSQILSVTANFQLVHVVLLYLVPVLLVFFVLLLGSYIFQYGEELQKLSDETL